MTKALIILLITFMAGFASATSCQDPTSCVPTANDSLNCIDYVKSVTRRGDNQNELQDIKRSCVNNFGSSCTSFLQSILKKTDLNNLTDYAKACEANYSDSCIRALFEASYVRSKNTLLDFARACKQNISGSCVNNAIEETGHIDYWSLKSHARSCQIYNRNLNRPRN